jgi:LysR family glycine cleavage system transcriptional activator
MRTYIPLNSLRAFEAAARHLSVSRAADELCVTPTAISHQIRALESFVGTSLFDRKGGKLVLTATTAQALRDLSEGFDLLETALLALSGRGERRKFVVAASPSIASLWLMPKLDRFLQLAPDIDLSLCTAIHENDFRDGAYDVAIASFGEIPGRRVDYLMDERIYPVAAPKLLAPRLTADRALATLPLIHDDKVADQFPTWRRYFEAHHLAERDCSAGLRFNQSSLALEAAIHGHGLLLGRSRLIAGAIADGRLTLVSPHAFPASFRYYALRPRGAEAPIVARFLDWVAEEVAAEDRVFGAEASIDKGVGVALGPYDGDRLADVDWRGEKRLVGQKRRRVGPLLADDRHPHIGTEILDVADAPAEP